MGRGFHSYVRLPVAGNKKCWVYPSTSSHLVAGILPRNQETPQWVTSPISGWLKIKITNIVFTNIIALTKWGLRQTPDVQNDPKNGGRQSPIRGLHRLNPEVFPAAKSPQGRRSRRMGLFASWERSQRSQRVVFKAVVFFSIFVWVFSSNGYIGYTSGKLTYLLKIAMCSWFTHRKWWFSIVMLVYQRVCNQWPLVSWPHHCSFSMPHVFPDQVLPTCVNPTQWGLKPIETNLNSWEELTWYIGI